MKKIIVLMLVLTGFAFSDLNAQSCCTTQTECKPQTCCPAQADCCEDGKGVFSFVRNLFSKETSELTEEHVVSTDESKNLKREELVALEEEEK